MFLFMLFIELSEKDVQKNRPCQLMDLNDSTIWLKYDPTYVIEPFVLDNDYKLTGKKHKMLIYEPGVNEGWVQNSKGSSARKSSLNELFSS